MPGASLEDSAVGEACKISSDPEDKAETTTKPKATTRHLSSPGGEVPLMNLALIEVRLQIWQVIRLVFSAYNQGMSGKFAEPAARS